MVYTHAKKISHTHVKDPVVHVRVRWTMETTKITQDALKKKKKKTIMASFVADGH